MSEQLVLLSALCALEAVPLRFNYFATFWNEVAATPSDAKLAEMLAECGAAAEYVDAVLLDERAALHDPAVHAFLQHYYPQLGSGTAASSAAALAEELAAHGGTAPLSTLLGDVRALTLLLGGAGAGAGAAGAALRAARTLQRRLVAAADEETSEPEALPEAAAEPVRCTTPDGSEPEEPDDLADESPAEEPPAPPRGAAYLTELRAAAAALAAAAQHALADG